MHDTMDAHAAASSLLYANIAWAERAPAMSEPGVDLAVTTSGRRAPHGGNEAAADEAGSAAPGRQQPADGPGAPHERDEVWIGRIDGFGGVAAAKERGKKTDEEEIAGRNVRRIFFLSAWVRL